MVASIIGLVLHRQFSIAPWLALAIGAYLVATTANAILETMISLAPNADALAASPHQPSPGDKGASLDLERIAGLLGLPLPKAPPDPADEGAKRARLASPVRSSLPQRLVGTLVANARSWSLASILDTRSHFPRTFMEGDDLDGSTIVEISRDRIFLMHKGQMEYIDGHGQEKAALGTGIPVNTLEKAPGSGTLGSGIRATSANEYEITKDEIANMLSHFPELSTEVRFTPVINDGQSTGLRLFSIRPNSTIAKLGVQNGDVLQRINGYELNSPEKALELYTKLQEMGRIDLQLIRNGAPIHKTYFVR